MSSWEDELESHRGPPPSQPQRQTQAGGDEDPFASDASPTATTGAAVQSSFSRNRPARSGASAAAAGAASSAASSSAAAPASSAAGDEHGDIMSHPLMQPPIFNSEVLGASIRASRETAAERGAMKAALGRSRAGDQARREIDHGDAERNDLSSQPSQWAPPPPPTLSELQRELMARALQQEPAQRAVTFQPLSDRLLRWAEEGAELDAEALDTRLRLLVQQFRDSRSAAADTSRRIWSANQHLHDMSVKLAAISCLDDFDRLAHHPTASANGAPAAATATLVPSTHFYDLHSLDLESYSDIKHLHQSSVAPPTGAGEGWWRTQLHELDEDPGEKRRRDAALLAAMQRPDLEEDNGDGGHRSDANADADPRPGSRARRESEAAHDHMLRDEVPVRSPSMSAAMAEMEAVLDEQAHGVNKPARRRF